MCCFYLILSLVNTFPRWLNTLPRRSNTLPGWFNTLPRRSNALPGWFNTLPGRSNALPGWFNTLPGRSNALPGWFNALPGFGIILLTETGYCIRFQIPSLHLPAPERFLTVGHCTSRHGNHPQNGVR